MLHNKMLVTKAVINRYLLSSSVYWNIC